MLAVAGGLVRRMNKRLTQGSSVTRAAQARFQPWDGASESEPHIAFARNDDRSGQSFWRLVCFDGSSCDCQVAGSIVVRTACGHADDSAYSFITSIFFL